MRVEEIITDKIVKLLEAGTAPWHKPWSTAGVSPSNAISRKAYRGINVLLLGCQPYSSPFWLTFKQAKDAGGSVKKGEKGSAIVFWKQLTKEQEQADGSVEERKFGMLRYYTVFNVEQTEACKLDLPAAVESSPVERIEHCERVYRDMAGKPELRHDAPQARFQAYYSPSLDYINLPAIERFDKAEFYYSVMFHELTHSTGHASRLDRATLTQMVRFGDTNYSKEELVAEMGAAMLAGITGIEQYTIENSAAYLNSWIGKMKGDPRLVIQAASQAQKAVDHILNRTAEIA
jgi:antirestriction protein ArdC